LQPILVIVGLIVLGKGVADYFLAFAADDRLRK